MKNLIILPLISVIIVALFLIACEKTQDIEQEKSESIQDWYDLYPDFFPTNYKHILSNQLNIRSGNNYPSDTIIYQIAYEIIEAEKRYPFLDSFISRFGYPEWNYSILKGTETDSFIVSIPFMTNPTDSSLWSS